MSAPSSSGGLSAPSRVRPAEVGRPFPFGTVFGAMAVAVIAAVGLLGLDRVPFPVCYLKAFTGLPCPTCGSTRAMARLFGLDVTGALSMNPLVTLAVLFLMAWSVSDLLGLARGRALRLEIPPTLARALRVAAVLLVLANWVYLLAAGR